MYQMQIIRLTQIDIAKHILFYYFDEIIIFNSCGDMVSKKKKKKNSCGDTKEINFWVYNI